MGEQAKRAEAGRWRRVSAGAQRLAHREVGHRHEIDRRAGGPSLAGCATPQGLAGAVRARGKGGRAVRLLLPLAVMLQVASAGTAWWLRRQGSFGAALGVGLLAAVLTTALVVAGIVVVRWLDSAESDVQRATAAARYLAAVVDSSSDAIVSTTPDGTVTAWNTGAQRLFGYTAAEAIGQDYTTLTCPPPERERLRQQRAHVAGGQRVEHLETRRLRKDGTTVEVSASAAPIVDPTGAVVGISIISHDITRRRRAEAGVRRLAAIVESSDDAINVVDLHGCFIAWNPGSERMFGYTAEQVIGRPVTFIAPRAEVPAVADRFARAGRGEHVAPYEARRSRADGRVIDVSVSLTPMRDDQGRVVAVSVITRDITAVKAAQADRARLAAIVEGCEDAIVAETLGGTITAWNPGAQVLYGYTASEAIGQPITTLMTEADARVLPALLRRVAAGQHIAHHEAQRIRKDGRIIDVSVTISPVLDESGAVVGASTIARDITAAKAARSEQARLAAIVRASDDAITSLDLNGRITAWNPGAERIYGYTVADMLGQIGTEVLDTPDGAAVVAEVLGRIAAGKTVQRYDAQRRRKDGTLIEVSVCLSPMFEADGSVTGVCCVARDITEVKAAQARELLIQERSQTAQRLENLGQLAGGVAHDFNNLLAVMLNYAEFIAEQVPADSQIAADVNQISMAAQRGAALTDQLMVFSRKQPAKTEVFDLNTLLDEVHGMLARTIGEHIQLLARTTPTPLAVRADRSRLQQVLLNMAFNARDAMPEGGTLIIEADGTDLDASSSALPGLSPGRYARLLVSDTGTGMPADVAAHIFEPFYTTKPKGQGTGLGLATAYATVTELGGTITVYSEPDLGTTMHIYVPRTDAADAAAEPTQRAQPPRGDGQLILVAEDEPAIRDMVRRALDCHGYNVAVADGGSEAVRLAAINRVDLLLTDVIMPDMNGRELAETLRRRAPGLPVIFMSGYSEGLVSTHSLLNDASTLIQKPFTANELLHTVHSVLADGTITPSLPRR